MVKGFLSRLLGGGPESREPAPAPAEEKSEVYEGFELTAAPLKEANGWRVAGRIAKGEGDARRCHEFVRADVFPSQDDAVDVSLRKARQIVDERGEKVFG